MRRSALAGLLLLCSACGSREALKPSPHPGQAPRPAGVLVSASGGRCTTVVVGTLVRRVCLPRGRPQPADTTARDTVRTDAEGSRAAAGGR